MYGVEPVVALLVNSLAGVDLSTLLGEVQKNPACRASAHKLQQAIAETNTLSGCGPNGRALGLTKTVGNSNTKLPAGR
jgi:hypothetical protein